MPSPRHRLDAGAIILVALADELGVQCLDIVDRYAHLGTGARITVVLRQVQPATSRETCM